MDKFSSFLANEAFWNAPKPEEEPILLTKAPGQPATKNTRDMSDQEIKAEIMRRADAGDNATAAKLAGILQKRALAKQQQTPQPQQQAQPPAQQQNPAVDLSRLPKPRTIYGSERWEDMIADPDAGYRIHNNPVGLSKGFKHYNAIQSGTKHLNDFLDLLPNPINRYLQTAGVEPKGDVTITQQLLDRLQATTRTRLNPKLVGLTLRFAAYQDSVGRTGAISHVFPPGVSPKRPV